MAVIEDPLAAAVLVAVGKHNCRATFDHHQERIEHFKQRIEELQLPPREALIVIINVDDPVGSIVADVLMPDQQHTWDDLRKRGEVPFARGIVMRAGFAKGLRSHDPEAADKLAGIERAVVVIDHGVTEVFAQ